MYTITINFEEKKESVLLKKIKAGESLLEVCLKQGIELSHQCGGICSCTTCCLYIEKGEEFLEVMLKRESDVLSMKNKRAENLRLGCQCLLLDGKGEIEITIPFLAGEHEVHKVDTRFTT